MVDHATIVALDTAPSASTTRHSRPLGTVTWFPVDTRSPGRGSGQRVIEEFDDPGRQLSGRIQVRAEVCDTDTQQTW